MAASESKATASYLASSPKNDGTCVHEWNKRGQGRGLRYISFSPDLLSRSMSDTAVVTDAGRVQIDCTIEVSSHPILTSNGELPLVYFLQRAKSKIHCKGELPTKYFSIQKKTSPPLEVPDASSEPHSSPPIISLRSDAPLQKKNRATIVAL